MSAIAAVDRDSLGARLNAAVARLNGAGVPDARLDAELLLAHVLGTERWRLRFDRGRPLPPAAIADFDRLIAGRVVRQPVSRLLGRREFWSLDFAIDEAVLDPRADSETLVEAALALVPDRGAPCAVLDLGTGSGCLLLALLSELPAAFGLGIDRAADAIRCARGNAAVFGLAARARFAVGDWGAALAPGHFDLVVTNPPYVATGEIAGLAPEVAGFDPRAALDGGADGLAAYRAIAAHLPQLLRAGGHAVLEHGAGQGEAVAGLLVEAGLAVTARRHDLAGKQRCLVATFECQDAIGMKIALGKRPNSG